MLRRMRVRSLDLYEAFGAECLITTTSLVQIRRIIKETDWTFSGIFIQVGFNRMATDKGVCR